MKKLITLFAITLMIASCGKNETSGGGNQNLANANWNLNNTNINGVQTQTYQEALSRRADVQNQMNAVAINTGVNSNSKYSFSEGSCSQGALGMTCSQGNQRRYIVESVSASEIVYELKKGILCLSNCSLGFYNYDTSVKTSDMNQVFNDNGRTLVSVNQGQMNGYNCYQINYGSTNNVTHQYVVCPQLPAIANPVEIKEYVSGGELRTLTGIN